MNKILIKKLLKEEFVSGEQSTKRAQKVSKEENKDYYKEVEDKMKNYDKPLKSDKNQNKGLKNDYEGSEKEYHDEMEIRNGQEMTTYDREPSEFFKDRAKKSLEGDSTMGNKVYTGEENGNTESVWNASDDEFGKKLVNTIKKSKKKRDDSVTPTTSFGDDIEIDKDKGNRIKKKQVAVESQKRIVFKRPFNGVDKAINLIPESFKVDNKTFELTDGNEKYKIRWEGTLTEGKAIILEAGDKNLVKEDFERIKNLMKYNSKDTFGNLNGKERIMENSKFKIDVNKIVNENTK